MAKNALVGLDIGSSSIKVCLLKENKRGFTLMSFGVIPLPPEAIVDGSIMNQTAVVEAIRELKLSKKIKAKEAAISFSGHSVILRKINVPVMTPEELVENIPYEAEQYIPFDINDVYIDTAILNEHNEQGQMDVLLVAAKKDMVNDFIESVTGAGLKSTVVDVDAFALQNAFEMNYDIPMGETVALINIGASVVNINIIRSGTSVFTRDLGQGGNHYTDEIQKQMSVSYEEAEALKTGGAGTGTSNVIPREVETILQQVSETIASDIQRSLDFYAATTSDARIDRIFIAGGCSRIPALGRHIEEKTGVSVEELNPFRQIDIGNRTIDQKFLKEQAHIATVALGLALRCSDPI